MRTRKEHYRRKLPHYQQPGQSYFITFILQGVMPKGALKKYLEALVQTKNRLYKLELLNPEEKAKQVTLSNEIQLAKKEYHIAQRKYKFAYDKTLHKSNAQSFSLLSMNNFEIIKEALNFWEGKKLHNHAWCVMSNHVHWVTSIFESDKFSKPVFLEDVLHSVKLFSARRINRNENLSGQLWEHESFDTTIRNDRHFINAVNYTIQNPVSANLVKHWSEWRYSHLESGLNNIF